MQKMRKVSVISPIWIHMTTGLDNDIYENLNARGRQLVSEKKTHVFLSHWI